MVLLEAEWNLSQIPWRQLPWSILHEMPSNPRRIERQCSNESRWLKVKAPRPSPTRDSSWSEFWLSACLPAPTLLGACALTCLVLLPCHPFRQLFQGNLDREPLWLLQIWSSRGCRVTWSRKLMSASVGEASPCRLFPVSGFRFRRHPASSSGRSSASGTVGRSPSRQALSPGPPISSTVLFHACQGTRPPKRASRPTASLYNCQSVSWWVWVGILQVGLLIWQVETHRDGSHPKYPDLGFKEVAVARGSSKEMKFVTYLWHHLRESVILRLTQKLLCFNSRILSVALYLSRREQHR